MQFTFNLVESGFIPAFTRRGEPIELGLRETLLRAGELSEVRGLSPVVTVSLYRLLLAILYRAVGPTDEREWIALWRGGQFPAEKLNAYFDRWSDRFDLFSPDRPFFQTAGWSAREPSGVRRLEHVLVVGSNAKHFHGVHDETPFHLSPPRAAQLVIAHQVYCMGGGRSETRYTTNGPLVKQVLSMPRGSNLFESLMLNLMPSAGGVGGAMPDVPVWERDESIDDFAKPTGMLDWLTWQSRKLALHPEVERGRVVVRRVSLAQGREPAPDWNDPWATYVETRDGGVMPLYLVEGREIWRDTATILAKHSGAGRRAAIIEWLADMARRTDVLRDTRLGLSVFGMCSDRVIISFWRHELLPLSPRFLRDESLVERLREAMRLAEACDQALRAAVWLVIAKTISIGDQRADSERVRASIDSVAPGRRYWSKLEAPMRDFLLDPDGHETAGDALVSLLSRTLAPAASCAFRESTGRLGRSARTLRAISLGEQRLNLELARLEQTIPAGAFA